MAVADQLVTDRFAIYNADAMEVLPSLPDGSIHLSLYSPPFGGMLYQYSSDPRDLSNTKDYAEFFDQYSYVIGEIHRVTMPGRMTAVHCQDIAAFNGDVHHILDFPGDVAREHVRCRKEGCCALPLMRERGMCGHGRFKQVAEYFVWKEPLTVRNRTMVRSLHHKTLTEDSTKTSIANADHLLIFRRSGVNPVPVAHPRGLLSYAGARQVPEELIKWRGHKGNQIQNEYSHWIWRQYASAFWDDIRVDRTLGTGAGLYSGNKAEKDEGDEKHMHPLQLDVIERALVLWSNPDETILTPFMGVGSEVYGAVINGRKGIGIELKSSYYRQAVRNLSEATVAASAPSVSGRVESPMLFGLDDAAAVE
jgi:hypothetical protein